MPDGESTVRARELGAVIGRAMRNARVTHKMAARKLGCSESKISTMLSGKSVFLPENVSALLVLCDIVGDERDRLIDLSRVARETGWWQKHGAWLPKNLQTYVDHEDAAATVQSFQALVLPGLLQTAAYMRALMSTSMMFQADQVDTAIALRSKRQEIFNRERPPQFGYFVHEHVLRLPMGGRDVMSEQLHHLLRMSVRSCISIRMVPIAVGSYAGLAGSFELMEFHEVKPIVCVESETSTLYLEDAEEIAAYQRILKSLASVALDEGQSREAIARLASDLGRPRREHDDLS